MISLTQYIKEAKSTTRNTPLAEILDNKGRILAQLSSSIQVGNGFSGFSMEDVKKHCSNGIFIFKTKNDMTDFLETTVSNSFWKIIYDYDTLNDQEPDYGHINNLMKIYGNVIEGKKLYIYTPTNGEDDKETLKNIKDLKERCDKASKTFKFASYQFLS